MEKNQTTHQWSAFVANNEKGNNRTVLALSDPVKGGESVTEKMKSCKLVITTLISSGRDKYTAINQDQIAMATTSPNSKIKTPGSTCFQ